MSSRDVIQSPGDEPMNFKKFATITGVLLTLGFLSKCHPDVQDATKETAAQIAHCIPDTGTDCIDEIDEEK